MSNDISSNTEAPSNEPIQTPAVPEFVEWIKDRRQTRRNVIASITAWPDGTEPELQATIQLIFERYAISIDGLQKYIIEGALVMDGVASFVVCERFGYSVFNALCQFSKVLSANQKERNSSGWEITFFEPDLTYKKVLNAWVISDCTFSNIHGPQGIRNIAEAPEVVKYEIGVHGNHQSDDEKVLAQAQSVLDKFNELNENPYDSERKHGIPAVYILRQAILEDHNYAWSWQCNLAMAFFDSWTNGNRPADIHKKANEGAARFMCNLFGVDVTQFDEWKSLEKDWKDIPESVAMVPIATYDCVEFSRYTLAWLDGAMPEGTLLYAPKAEVEAKRISGLKMLASIPSAEEVEAKSKTSVEPVNHDQPADEVQPEGNYPHSDKTLDASSTHHAEDTRGREQW